MGANSENGKFPLHFFFWLVVFGLTSFCSAQESLTLARRAADLQSSGKPDSALVLFRQALSLAGPTTPMAVRCLNGIADNLVPLGHVDSAVAVLHEALRIGEGRDTSFESGLAQTYASLSVLTAYRESEVPKAVAYARRSCELREKRYGPGSAVTAKSYYVLGYAFKKAGMFDSAIVVLSRALDNQERAGAGREAIATRLVLGTVLENVGRYAEAVRIHTGCLKQLDEAGLAVSDQALTCHSYLSVSHYLIGEMREAIDHARKALALSIRLHGPDAVYTSGCYGQLGEYSAETGDYERAHEYCARSLAIADSAQGAQPSGVAGVCRMLSRIERQRGRPAAALPYVERGLAIARGLEGGAAPETARLLDEAALVSAALGDTARALDHWRGSIAVKQALSDDRPTVDLAATHLAMAEVCRKIPDSSRARIAESERLLEACTDRNVLLESRILALKGTLETDAGKYRAAAGWFQMSLAALSPGVSSTDLTVNPAGCTLETGEHLLDVLSKKAFALARLGGNRDTSSGRASLAAYEAAADIATRMQHSFPLQASKLSLRERTASLYRAGVETAATLFDATGDAAFADQAFVFAERSRAGLLAENLDRLDAQASLPDSLQERAGLIAAEIRACEIAIDKAARSPRSLSAAEPRARLFALRQELDRLGLPQETDARGELPDLAAIQRGLPADLALIEYAKTAGRLRIFVVRRDVFRMTGGPSFEPVAERVRSLRRAIKTLDRTQYAADAAALYASLIAPVRRMLNHCTRLVIVPDEELALIPFETLAPATPGAASTGPDFTSLPYLLKSFEIAYAPSASLYHRRHGEHKGPRSFAGFAPVFREGQTGLIAALRSINVDGTEYGELKYSEEEVRTILSSFQRAGSKGVAYVNGTATKAELVKALVTSSHVHIATHGFANDSLPGLSGLVLASPAGTPEVLYARETYGLRSDADLLVLSACETGIGRIAKGEGVMALTHGFLSAGVHNVVYSLWRVMDRPSSELMIRFYANMKPGVRYEEALRRAKLEMIRTTGTAFPYHWAGFVLVRG